MRKFAISDIHGCNQTFQALLAKIDLQKKDALYLLGDFVDRGPDSKGVFDTIFQLMEEGYQVKCLKGNHEQQMQTARLDPKALNEWRQWGGKQTMNSFRVLNLEGVQDVYWSFIDQLHSYLEIDDYILAHAGLNFDTPDPLMDQWALMWIRNWYNSIDYDWLGHRIVIHGHTPTTETKIRENLAQLDELQYFDIDCGCFYVLEPDMGKLCAFDMTNREVYFQKNIDNMNSWLLQMMRGR